MNKQLSFVPPAALDSLDGEIKIDLPKIEDIKNPVIQKVLLRLEELKTLSATNTHKQHHSHDRTAYSKGWVPGM